MTNVEMILGIITSAIAVIGGFTALIKWMVKHYLYELKPNGGGSLKDQVNRLEAQVQTILDIIRKEI